jgi:hypothetical protein
MIEGRARGGALDRPGRKYAGGGGVKDDTRIGQSDEPDLENQDAATYQRNFARQGEANRDARAIDKGIVGAGGGRTKPRYLIHDPEDEYAAGGDVPAGRRTTTREDAGELLSRGRSQSRDTDLNLTPGPDFGAPVRPIPTRDHPSYIPQTLPNAGPTDMPPITNRAARGGGIHIKPSHKGLLHKDLGVPSGEKIPAAKLQAALHSDDPAVRKRANFARNAKKFEH